MKNLLENNNNKNTTIPNFIWKLWKIFSKIIGRDKK
jgi:hypothetical protein